MTGQAAARQVPQASMATRFPAWLLLGGVVVAAFAVAIAMSLHLVDGSDSVLGRVTVVCFTIGMTALVLTGSAVLQRDRMHPMGWWLVAAGIAGLVSRLVTGGLVALEHSGVELPAGVLWLVNWIWVPAQFTLFELLLRFPSGRLPGRGWRVVEVIGIAWALAALVVLAVVPGPLGADPLIHVQNPFGLPAASELLTAALTPVFLVGNVLIVIGCGAPIWRWMRRGRGSEERQQLRWVLATVCFLALAVPAAALVGALELAEAAAWLAIPAAIAVAVHRDGLWGLGRAVRRTLIYATATAVLAAGYLIFVLTWDAPTMPLLAALVVAVLALPVRNAVQWLLLRVLYGRRGAPDTAVATLGEGLRRAAESPSVTVVRVVADSLRVPWVAIEDVHGRVIAETTWRDGKDVSSGSGSGSGSGASSGSGPGSGAHPDAVRIELTAHGAPVGQLVVAERAPGEGLDGRDRRLLEQIAPQAALVARAEELTAHLAGSYANLVSVREEERGRLQRELHDELGPMLAGIVMQSEAARNLARNIGDGNGDGNEEAARRLDGVLEQIGRTSETMVDNVRRIIAELRPVSLQAQGLHAAVTEAVSMIAPGLDASVDVPAGDLALSAVEELAVFRVTTEAVRNVFRHARADMLVVRIIDTGDAVIVHVEDNGTGIADAPAGVGLRAMRERVEALGGTFVVGVGSDASGTLVRAVIPKALA